jgi:hypothetical protein
MRVSEDSGDHRFGDGEQESREGNTQLAVYRHYIVDRQLYIDD